MSAASFCLQRSAAQLKSFRLQKQYWKAWNNISSEPRCKKGKSVMVLNEIPLDTFTSKVFYNKIILFMK